MCTQSTLKQVIEYDMKSKYPEEYLTAVKDMKVCHENFSRGFGLIRQQLFNLLKIKISINGISTNLAVFEINVQLYI